MTRFFCIFIFLFIRVFYDRWATHNELKGEGLEGSGGEVPGPPALGEVDQAQGGRGAHHHAEEGVAVHFGQHLPDQVTKGQVTQGKKTMTM